MTNTTPALTLRPLKPGTMGAPAHAFTAYVRGIHVIYSTRQSWRPGLAWTVQSADGQMTHFGLGTLKQACELSDWMTGNISENRSEYAQRQQAILDTLEAEAFALGGGA